MSLDTRTCLVARRSSPLARSDGAWAPLDIGGVSISPPAVLAPLAGVSVPPFRRFCRELGAGLVCSEMVSANALAYRNPKTALMLHICHDEHPVSVQILAPTPDVAEPAAQAAAEAGADVVDINMGCPVPKVLRCRAGVDLMRDPHRARAVMEAAVRGVSGRVPVTVKIRAGWDPSAPCFARIARHAEDAGLSAIILHARYGCQGYSGHADWSLIAELKDQTSLPVVGNGDIRCVADAARMRAQTGCDGVMVGRWAMGNPWIFRELSAAAQGRAVPAGAQPAERIDALLRLGREMVSFYGEHRGLRELRGFVCWFTKGLPSSAMLRAEALRLASLEDLQALLLGFRETLSDHATEE